eukprot:2120648-Pyramimonas_sp.AAC.1
MQCSSRTVTTTAHATPEAFPSQEAAQARVGAAATSIDSRTARSGGKKEQQQSQQTSVPQHQR